MREANTQNKQGCYMQTEKIVITGLGVVTPVGIGVPDFWHNLVSGICGIKKLDDFTSRDIPVSVAAKVLDFVPEDYMSKRFARNNSRFSQFAYVAANEALSQSGLDVSKDPRRVGISLGTAMAGVSVIAQTQEDIDATGKTKVSPFFVPQMLGNVSAAQIAIEKGIMGPCVTVSTACSSGGDALGMAYMFLQNGKADAMVAVGTDSAHNPLVASSLSTAKALTSSTDEKTACRPFDLERDGFVLGEGAGAIILETESHAKNRGADILGYLAGVSNNTDAYHIVAPAPDGHGEIACMKDALKVAGLSPSDIGYINAHGTSTAAGDKIECNSVRAVFGNDAPPISSTKGATGHMMGAGGITEAIACLLSIRDGVIPPTVGCVNKDPECDADIVQTTARYTNMSYAMSNSFGFGGQNASVIIGAY